MQCFLSFKKILKAFIACALVFGLYKFCHKQTGGFQIYKISLKEKPKVDFTAATPLSITDLPNEALLQPYFYLSGGGECYVFESLDHKWVIKFFKNHHFTSMTWVDAFPKPEKAKKMLDKRRKLAKKFWQSCLYASNDLKDLTATSFFQVLPTFDQDCFITLYDRLGIEHKVNLKNIPFALQPKLQMFLPALEKDIKEGKSEAAKAKIGAAIEVFITLYKRGYRNWDPEIKRNLALQNDKAIFIDLGAFEKNNKCKTKEEFRQDLERATLRLDTELKNLDTGLLEYYKHTLSTAIDKLAAVKPTDTTSNILNRNSSQN